MPTSTIHPTTHNIFDGGSPVDLEHPCESTMSNNNKKKEYYNQTDFDEMIADVIEPAKRNRGRQQQHHATAHYDDEDQYQQNEYEQDSFSSSTDNDSEQYSSPQQQPRIMVDTLPTSTDSRSISDQEDEEVISLNSDDISGGSDISDMEQQRPKDDRNNNDNFTPRPLINDDESTVDMRPPAPINQSVSSYVEALNQQQMRKNRIVRFGALLILLGVIVGVVLGIVSVTNGGDDEGSSSSELNNGGGEGYGLESGQISVKESFVGNTTTNSPSLSPVYLDEDLLSPVTTVSLGGGSPTIPPQSAFPTKNPTLPPQSALPARDPTLAPVDVISTDAPVTVTNSPVTPDPTPEVCLNHYLIFERLSLLMNWLMLTFFSVWSEFVANTKSNDL